MNLEMHFDVLPLDFRTGLDYKSARWQAFRSYLDNIAWNGMQNLMPHEGAVFLFEKLQFGCRQFYQATLACKGAERVERVSR